MASPVSIGDAFLLAKLALTLGRTFTTGRKSAPAEFREIESQLYSISTALSALGDACKSDGLKLGIGGSGPPHNLQHFQTSGGVDSLLWMLKGCQDVLKHLEVVVDKYSSIRELDQNANGKNSGFRKWNSGIKKNWRKILWTTEGGDLASLQRSLSMHINCLDLALSVISNTQTTHIEHSVDNITLMLTEIHTWLAANARNQSFGTQNINTTHNPTTVSIVGASLFSIRFKVSAKSSNGLEALCPNASVHPLWGKKHDRGDSSSGGSQGQLFKCHCSIQVGQSAPDPCGIDSLNISPFTFTLRRTGSPITWMVYNAANRSTNRVLSLVIENIPAQSIHEFEASFINILATKNARSMLRPGFGTTLAYLTIGESNINEHRVLNLLSDLEQIRGKVDEITFTINRQSYVRAGIATIQLMHYKASKSDFVPGHIIDPADLLPLDTAELEITYVKESNPDIEKSILYLSYQTVVKCSLGSSTVQLDGIVCAGLTSTNQENIIRGVDVSIQLASSQAAGELQRKIQQMKTELFIMSLKKPRPDERLALKLQAKGFHTDQVDIADCEISIVQSEPSGNLRLIIISNDERTILSQELAKDFMNSVEGIPRFTSPTYVVQVLGHGTREIRTYRNGFRMVDFSEVRRDQLFGLGLAVLSGNATPPAQICQESLSHGTQ
ncbi:hypothetical protein TWF481_000082 [Arthrobotrys musiformis]|uniref:Fungal N-terminal domain-containing protein n=1 Tax=Arthrobotrys musiformis TaxID=47236 RepID=A0AAV9WNQ2_9PEZI